MFTMNILQNEVVRLRAPEFSDLDLIYEWENNPEIWLISNTITPFSKYVLKKYLETAHLDLYQSKQLRLMIDAKNTEDALYPTIGSIDLFDFDPYHQRAGIGILIAETRYRQKGYATYALDLISTYCFTALSLKQLWCSIPADNEASLKLFLKEGFEICGKRKNWLKTGNGWLDDYFLQKQSPF